MSAKIREILGNDRWDKLNEFAEKLGIDPESILRDIVDMKLCCNEESSIDG